jgi:hypothetical protein
VIPAIVHVILVYVIVSAIAICVIVCSLLRAVDHPFMRQWLSLASRDRSEPPNHSQGAKVEVAVEVRTHVLEAQLICYLVSCIMYHVAVIGIRVSVMQPPTSGGPSLYGTVVELSE